MSWQYQNPFLPQMQPNPYAMMPQQQAPVLQVVRVSGRGGAEAFQMGPNSSALLLDESGTIVWAVTTDGAGYKTISPYDITPHKDAPAPDYGSLESRIARLEGFMHELTGNPTATGGGESAAGANQKSDGNGARR